MPNVVQENTAEQTTVYTVQLPAEEIKQKVDAELKKLRKTVQIKGFRKGKVPISFLRKNYGQAVIADIINKGINEGLDEAVEGKKDFLGQLIPVAGQKVLTADINNIEDAEQKFEIGIKPDFEIKGLEDTHSFTYYDTEVPDEAADEHIANARKRAGERILDEEKIEEGDMIKFHVRELADGAVKEGGVENEFSVLWETFADEDLKKELLTKKKGDRVTVNPFKIEKDSRDEYVRKYMLDIGEDTEVGETFEAEIIEVSRIQAAEMNEEFFTDAFGEKVKTEAEARDFIKGEIKKSYDNSADAMLFRVVQDRLIEQNKDISLPDAFLKRFLVFQSEENTEESVEKGYDDFAEGIRWDLMRSQLFDKYGVKITEADLREHFARQIMGYMGGYADANIINATVDRVMQNRQQVERAATQIGTQQMMLQLKEDLNLDKKSVSKEEMEKVISDFNEKHAPQPAADEEE